MEAAPYKVCIVVDREFGKRLAEIDRGTPVWIVDTPTNKPVAQRLWRERLNDSHLTSITTFTDTESGAPEDLLLAQISTIDLHHGSYSASPPYTMIEVFGTPLTSRVKSGLSQFGFREFRDTPRGFAAVRVEDVETT